MEMVWRSFLPSLPCACFVERIRGGAMGFHCSIVSVIPALTSSVEHQAGITTSSLR
jgi:hypothetical protein